MIAGILLSVAGITALCGLLYCFAIYALPAYIGLSVGHWAIGAGIGTIPGIVIGLVVAVITFGIGQAISVTTRNAALRWFVVLLFCTPAAIAGYTMMLHFSEELVTTSPVWQHVLSIAAGAATGLTAIIRIGWTTPTRTPQEVNDFARPWTIGCHQTSFGKDEPELTVVSRQRALPPFHH